MLITSIFFMRISILTLSILSFNSYAFCFDEAGKHYNVNPKLLKAIATVESSLNKNAINENKNQSGKVVSRDYGLMQINSKWFPKLSKFGVDEITVFDPCYNVHLGAWVLSSNFSSHGYNWNSIGAYNAGFREKSAPARLVYINKVKAALAKLK